MNNKIFVNATWIILCRIGQSVLSLVIGMLTARYLGPSNFGLINYAASIVSFFTPIMYLGFNSTLVQEILNNENREGNILGSALFASFTMSIFCIVGIILFVLIANPNDEITIQVCSLYSLMLVFQSFDLIQYWFQAKLKSKYTSLIMLFAFCVVSLYKAYLLIEQKSILWFALSNALDYFIIAILFLYFYRKFAEKKLEYSTKVIRCLIKTSKYYVLSNLMVIVFTHTDKIMLKILLDNEATGLYSAAVTCTCMSSFIFSAIIDSMRPLILKNYVKSSIKFKHNLSKLYSIVFLLSLLQCLVLFLCAEPVIHIIYGDSFQGAKGILQFLTWYTVFAYLGSVRGIWLLATGNQSYLLLINLLCAVSNIFLNIILIPILGVYGAVIATLLTQFFGNVLVGSFISNLRENNTIMLHGIRLKMFKIIIKNLFKRARNIAKDSCFDS